MTHTYSRSSDSYISAGRSGFYAHGDLAASERQADVGETPPRQAPSAAQAGETANVHYQDYQCTRSKVTVPVLVHGNLLGVLFVDSQQHGLPDLNNQSVLSAMAGHLEAAIELARSGREALNGVPAPRATEGQEALRIRRAANSSIFINDTYLIKGVAGSIFWRLLDDYLYKGRTEFTNRELRTDRSLNLPDVVDNLEVRLIMLQRRLQAHGPDIRIEKVARGRFKLVVTRKIELATT